MGKDNSRFYYFGLAFILLVSVLYPYLAVLGGYPMMDEGFYVFMGYSYHKALIAGAPLPQIQGLAFYPLIFSWIYYLPGSPLIWFRLVDMFMALGAGCLLCRIIRLESGNSYFALLAGFVALCGMTESQVIDCGFKNSFFPAYICFFSAYLLIADKQKPAFYLAGILTAIGVFLRETFFPFSILGFASVWIAWGFKKSLVYALGGVSGIILILSGLYATNPDTLSYLTQGYMDRTLVYSSQADKILPYFFNHFHDSIEKFNGIILLAAACIGLHLYIKNGINRYKAIFWAMAGILPLWEPLVKIGFVYHFSVCIPGIICMGAVFIRGITIREITEKFKKISLRIFELISAYSLVVSILLLPSPATAMRNMQNLANFPRLEWTDEMRKTSVALEALKVIKQYLPSNGTLSTSAFNFFFYPASGHWPPDKGWFDPDDDYKLSDLSRIYAYMGRNSARLVEAIRKNPPDVIVIGVPVGAHENSYAPEMLDVVEKTGLYRQVGDIAADKGEILRNFGWIGYRIFARK